MTFQGHIADLITRASIWNVSHAEKQRCFFWKVSYRLCFDNPFSIVERRVHLFTEGRKSPMYTERCLCNLFPLFLKVLNFGYIACTFLFHWIQRDSGRFALQLRHARVEPENIRKSKGSNSVYDWIGVLVGLLIFVVVEAEMHHWRLLILFCSLMAIAWQLDAVDPVKRSGSVHLDILSLGPCFQVGKMKLL